jgi:hypothetical protein
LESHRHHIHPVRSGPQGLRRSEEAALLLHGHGEERITSDARLHLDRDQRGSEGDQQVYLTTPGTDIAGHQARPATLQEPRGNEFAEAS